MVAGDLIKEARRRAGLSQAEVAKRAGKPTSVVGRWERDEVRPSYETLRAIVNACGLELAISLREVDRSHDATIRNALAFTPAERLRQLERTANFIRKGRSSAAAS